MKKLIIVIIAAFIIMPILASADNNIKYIKANGKVYLGNKIKEGLSNMTITTTTGEIVKIPNTQIEGYMTSRARYDLLPLDNNSSMKVMMKFVAIRQDLSLYVFQTTDFLETTDYYRVYQDGVLYLKVTESNVDEILPFFGIKTY